MKTFIKTFKLQCYLQNHQIHIKLKILILNNSEHYH